MARFSCIFTGKKKKGGAGLNYQGYSDSKQNIF